MTKQQHIDMVKSMSHEELLELLKDDIDKPLYRNYKKTPLALKAKALWVIEHLINFEE